LGNFRRLVVRYEWLAHVYWAFVLLAFILICLDRILKQLVGAVKVVAFAAEKVGLSERGIYRALKRQAA
jgi:hypothetical protein